ncbi:hypothetical protein, partial [Erythrobacter sp. MTPC3]
MKHSAIHYKRLLLTTTGAVAISLPSAALAQDAVNTATVAVPAGANDSTSGNNSATDSDTIFAV